MFSSVISGRKVTKRIDIFTEKKADLYLTPMPFHFHTPLSAYRFRCRYLACVSSQCHYRKVMTIIPKLHVQVSGEPSCGVVDEGPSRLLSSLVLDLRLNEIHNAFLYAFTFATRYQIQKEKMSQRLP